MSILGIGDADVDIYIEVDKVPSYDEKVFARSTSLHAGGMVLNFLVCLQNLGNKCEFYGVIGDDNYGEIIINLLMKYNINKKNIIINKGGETYYCYIILDTLGEKLLIIIPTNCLFIEDHQVHKKVFLSKKHVHTTSGNINTALKVINISKKNNISVSIDIENVVDYNLFIKLVKDVDILFINFNSFRKLGFDDLNKGLNEIIKHGTRVICLTKGKDGSITFTKNNIFSFDGYNVEVKDTTGAGDCFAAGYIHGYIRNWDINRTTIFANAVAALSTTMIGGSSFKMNDYHVESFIKSYT